MPGNSTGLGAFFGSTIPDNQDIKAALQALETEVENTSLTVKADSTAFLDITGNELSLKSLAITSVKVNTVETSLADYITNEATEFGALEEGDVLILTQADSQYRSWVHNGGSAGDANDMTRLQTDITPSAIRSYFTGGDGLAYDNATGDFDVNVDDSSIEISSDSLQVKADGIKDSHIDWGSGVHQVSGSDVPLDSYSWDRITNPADVQDALEKLDSDIAGIVSSGSVALNNGVASDGNNDGSVDVRVDLSSIEVDGSNNLRVKDLGIIRAMLEADAVDGSKLADDSVDSEHVASGAIDFDHFAAASYSTDLSSSASSSELVRADAAKSYVDGKRYKASSISLTADTAFTVNHGLGEKYVAFSAYDSSDRMLDLQVDLTDANNLTVTSTSTQSGITVVVVA